jgi:uncharacterized membrane protein YphA (DoxX/SURF4 family)
MNKLKLLSTSIGLIYIWFGALKLMPTLSPAEGLAGRTIELITFDLISDDLARLLLAGIEILIGIGLMLGFKPKFVIKAALCHMICTFIPLFAFPEISFAQAPFAFTIVGQYIMKNLIIIVALLILLPEKKVEVQNAVN